MKKLFRSKSERKFRKVRQSLDEEGKLENSSVNVKSTESLNACASPFNHTPTSIQGQPSSILDQPPSFPKSDDPASLPSIQFKKDNAHSTFQAKEFPPSFKMTADELDVRKRISEDGNGGHLKVPVSLLENMNLSMKKVYEEVMRLSKETQSINTTISVITEKLDGYAEQNRIHGELSDLKEEIRTIKSTMQRNSNSLDLIAENTKISIAQPSTQEN